MGRNPWAAQSERLLIVVVAEEKRGLRARIELRELGGAIRGRRELAASSGGCGALMEALELAICIALEPMSAVAGLAPAERHVKVASVANQLPRRPQEPSPIGVAASVAGSVTVGATPSAGGSIAAHVRLRWRWLSVAGGIRFDPPTFKLLRQGEVSGTLVLGSAVPCLHRGRWASCAVVALGAMHGAGHGLADPDGVWLGYVAGGIRLGYEISLWRGLGLRPYGDLLFTLTRITLRDSQTRAIFWRAPPVSAAFGLAAVGNFL